MKKVVACVVLVIVCCALIGAIVYTQTDLFGTDDSSKDVDEYPSEGYIVVRSEEDIPSGKRVDTNERK